MPALKLFLPVPYSDNVVVPVFGKHVRVYVAPLVLHSRKPNELKVYVVVGYGRRHVLHKAVHVVNSAVTLERCAQSAPYVLAEIAAL